MANTFFFTDFTFVLFFADSEHGPGSSETPLWQVSWPSVDSELGGPGKELPNSPGKKNKKKKKKQKKKVYKKETEYNSNKKTDREVNTKAIKNS